MEGSCKEAPLPGGRQRAVAQQPAPCRFAAAAAVPAPGGPQLHWHRGTGQKGEAGPRAAVNVLLSCTHKGTLGMCGGSFLVVRR